MKDEFWLDKWRRGDIKFNQVSANQLLLDYYPELELQPGDRIFVPLCGKSIDMLWLAKMGLSVVGVELSSIACEAFFSENNLPYSIHQQAEFTVYQGEQVTIFCGDFFKLRLEMLKGVRAVYDRASLVALPLDIQQAYVDHTASLLDSGARTLLATISYDPMQMNGPPFSTPGERVEQLYLPLFSMKELKSGPCSIPEHLKQRGLLTAEEGIYLITKR